LYPSELGRLQDLVLSQGTRSPQKHHIMDKHSHPVCEIFHGRQIDVLNVFLSPILSVNVLTLLRFWRSFSLFFPRVVIFKSI